MGEEKSERGAPPPIPVGSALNLTMPVEPEFPAAVALPPELAKRAAGVNLTMEQVEMMLGMYSVEELLIGVCFFNPSHNCSHRAWVRGG